MYEHHKTSINNLINYFKDDLDVIAIILGGSIAKGIERPDSDVDAIVVVSEEKYNQLNRSNQLSECIFGYCTYEHGYFDIKYCTEKYLISVMQKGSEPSRNAFKSSRCLYSKNSKIEEWINKIPLFQKQEKQEKLLSFYSAFNLNYGYFWGSSSNDIYLRTRTATDIVLFGFRILLQESEVLFPCHKGLMESVIDLKNKPEDIINKATKLLTTLSDESKDDFVNSILNFIGYKPPKDFSEVLTRFIDDNELWWYKERPVIAEW